MKKKRFSIIVPIYNVKPYLDRCVGSLLSQGRDDYEIILVDDGSTDGSGRIADQFADQYSIISCVHKENGGLSSARNKGLEYAQGDYILFVDSDDWIDNNALSILANVISPNEPDVVKFNYVRMPSGEKIETSITPGIYDRYKIKEKLLPTALEKTGEFIFSAWSYLYKRELLSKNRITFISERVIGSEDYQFNTNVFLHANSLLMIEEALYFYDYREGSLTFGYRPNIIAQYQNLHEALYKTIFDAGEIHRYEKTLMKAYVWKCFSTCVRNEMIVTETHSFWDGFRNCKRMFSSNLFRGAIKKVDYSMEPIGIRMRFNLMRMNFVFPLVYTQYRSNKK